MVGWPKVTAAISPSSWFSEANAGNLRHAASRTAESAKAERELKDAEKIGKLKARS